MLNSLNWSESISVGASVKRQADDCVLGNAIVSLIEVRFFKIITILSKPKAIPAWGGQPYSSASRKKPNLLSISSLSNIVCDIRSSILPDPNKIFNAGSFFKNPIVKKLDISYSFFKSDNLITWEVDETHVKVGAARLIELIKDKIIPSDNVSIYKNHSLVLVTNGRATQNEVLAFASQIQELISKFFNINLEIEPTVIK